MLRVTEKYFCDRCGKETDQPYYPKLQLAIKRFKRKRLVAIWNGERSRFESSDLCKTCAKSFDEWWAAGSKVTNVD